MIFRIFFENFLIFRRFHAIFVERPTRFWPQAFSHVARAAETPRKSEDHECELHTIFAKS